MIQKWQQMSPNETLIGHWPQDSSSNSAPCWLARLPLRLQFSHLQNERLVSPVLNCKLPSGRIQRHLASKVLGKSPQQGGTHYLVSVLALSRHQEREAPTKNMPCLSSHWSPWVQWMRLQGAGGLVIVDEGSLPGLTCTYDPVPMSMAGKIWRKG